MTQLLGTCKHDGVGQFVLSKIERRKGVKQAVGHGVSAAAALSEVFLQYGSARQEGGSFRRQLPSGVDEARGPTSTRGRSAHDRNRVDIFLAQKGEFDPRK